MGKDLEYLLEGNHNLAEALASINARNYSKFNESIVNICKKEFRTDDVIFIGPEEVRNHFADQKDILENLREGNHFGEGNSFYVPLKWNGERNLGVIVLNKVNLKFLEQDQEEKNRVFDYLGKHSGQILGLLKLAGYDALTGLLRKDLFDEMYQESFSKAKREKEPLSAILIDLDHFGKYNNSFGHIQGDEALRAVGKVISSSLNRSPDYAVRYGGEEFTVILPNTDVLGAEEIGKRINSRIKDISIPIVDNEESKNVQYPLEIDRINCSVGIATFPNHAEDSIRLIRLADKALYQAKDNGRDQVVVYIVYD